MPMHVSIVSVKNHKYIRVCSSYRNAEGKPRTRVIENHGRLETALEKDPEFLDKLKARIAEENRLEQLAKDRELELQARKRMDKLSELAQSNNDLPGCFHLYNVGAAIIRKVWCDLKMPEFFRYLQKDRNIGYSYDKAAYLLTEQRLLAPASKLQNFKNKDSSIIDHSEIDHLQDLYRVLDLLKEDKESVVKHLNREIQKRTKRKITAAFYDVTTYSFESRNISDYKDFGLSKDHKVNEVQVVLGLVMDENGIPIDYELFNGSTNEFGTMVPLIKKIKTTYGIDQLIVVADRGLNSSENLFALRQIGCDFVIAQKFKNASADEKKAILDQNNWQKSTCDENGEIFCRYKTIEVNKPLYETRTSPTTKLNYKTKKVIDTMNLHWIVSYSPRRAKKDRADRDRAIDKALDAIKNPGKLRLTGYKSLVKMPRKDGAPQLDTEKIEEQSQWDGYYVICTNLEISPERATEIYRKLWQIEDCFRVSKSQLETRPCFVWTDSHIYGHFLSCFISLVLEKYMLYSLKQELGDQVTHGKMCSALRQSQVVYDDINPQLPLFLRLYEPGLFDEMSKHFGLKVLSRVEKPVGLKKKLHLPGLKVVATTAWKS